MEIKLNINDFLSKLNQEINLTQADRKDIFTYFDKEVLHYVTKEYEDKVKKIIYFSFQDNKKILCSIKNNDLVLESNIEEVLALLYNNENNVVIKINDTEENIKNILKDVDYTIESSDDYVLKHNFFNWKDKISKILVKPVSEEENQEIKKEQERLETINESKEILSIIQQSSTITRKHYLLKRSNVDDLINYSMRSNVNFEMVQSYFRMMKDYVAMIDLIQKFDDLNDIDNYNKNKVLNFIEKELKNGRVSSFYYEKYINFINREANKDLKENFSNFNHNFKNIDEFYYASKELLIKKASYLDSKEKLLLPEVSGKYIHFHFSEISPDLREDTEVFKKILPFFRDIDFINVEKFKFIESLSIDVLADFWLISPKNMRRCASFIKGINKKKSFIDFVKTIKEKRPSDYISHCKIDSAYYYIYRRLKKDKEIVNLLLDEGFDFNYFESLEAKDFDKVLVDKMFDKNLHKYIAPDVLKKETDKNRILKILMSESMSGDNIPKEWINPDILFSINTLAFNNLHIDFENIDLDKFTGGDFENYKELIIRKPSIFKAFPKELKENEDLLKVLMEKDLKFAMDNMPDKFLYNKEYMLKHIEKYNNFAGIIPDILWEVDDFLIKYLEILDMDKEKNKRLLSYLPIEIQNFIGKSMVKENYAGFMQKIYLHEKLEEKPLKKSIKL